MRAGAESSRTTASVGSLGEQTLFAQRSPYGHPKSEIRSQVCFGRGDLTLWIGGPSGEARPPRRTSNGPDGGGLGATRTPAPARPRRDAVLDPRPIGPPRLGCQSGDRRPPLGDRQPCTAGDRGRCQRERSWTVPVRAIADAASVSDHRRCQRRRQHCAIGGDAHGLAVRLGAGVRLSTVRSSTRPPLARPRLSQSLP